MSAPLLSTDHEALTQTLLDSNRLLLIQDLDGVCMGLVRDPRTRRIERRYLEAAVDLAGEFFVLTNGEHDGPRGVNAIADAAYADGDDPPTHGRYLPGLAAGGVQLQDRLGAITHPGVSVREIRFLEAVPGRAKQFLGNYLADPGFALSAPERDQLIGACVLDNRLSPTLNLNPLHERLANRVARYQQLQTLAMDFLAAELARARKEGLTDAFFAHLAPNLGRDENGLERLRPAQGADAGTTDFQLMLRGAVKEAGVLALLNRYYYEHYGAFPLGENFNAREAPVAEDDLVDLARRRFDPALMPRVVGIGDTVTSLIQGADVQRGGSDRGFLQLVQAIGREFDSGNFCVLVDSSAGEVRRPGLGKPLTCDGLPNWSALKGISDANDPLQINYLFPGGHRAYVEFFCDLAARRRKSTAA